MRLSAVAAAFLSFLSILASAQEAPSPEPTDQDVEELMALINEVIVSASRWEQILSKAPAKIVVITADEIRNRGYRGIDELFHDIAGVDVTKGRGVEWTTIYMRGMRTENTDRFLLIWDGVIQNDTWKYNVWVSRQYPLTNIDHIEIMYGPSSLLYGANAFAGIINVILKKPSEVNGMAVNVMAGSYNTRLAELNFGKQYGDWRFMANGRWFLSDEMDMSGKYWIDNAGRRRYHDFQLARDGRRDPSHPSGYDARLKVLGGVPHQTFDGKDVPFDGRPYGDTKDWFMQGGIGYKAFELRAFYWYRQEIEDNWYVPLRRMHGPWTPTGSAVYLTHEAQLPRNMFLTSSVRTSHAGLYDDYSYDGAFIRTIDDNTKGPPDNLVVSGLNDSPVEWYSLSNREWRAGQQLNLTGSRYDLKLVLGWEYTATKNYEDYNRRALSSQPFNYTPQHKERNRAAFVNAQLNPHRLFSVAGGLRYDYNYLSGEDGGFGNLITGRAAGIFTPSDKHTVKLIYGQAFQAPSPWHKFARVPRDRELQNPNLKPEKLSSVELVYDFNPSLQWRNSLAVYSTRISDLIAGVNVPFGSTTTQQHQNSGGLKIFGQEFESRYYFDARNSIYANATFSRTEKDNGDRQGDLAPFKANLGADLVLRGRYGLNLRGHYVSGRDTITKVDPKTHGASRVDGYFAADAAFTWMEVAKNLDFRAVVNNLFDTQYYDPGVRTADGRGFNGMIIQEGRRGYLGVSYRF